MILLGEDELHVAARAGMMLLEKNAELESTIEDLHDDILTYQNHYRELAMEAEVLREQRKEAVMEVQEAHRDIKALRSQIINQQIEWERIHEELQDSIQHLRTDLHLAKTAPCQHQIAALQLHLDQENEQDTNAQVVPPDASDSVLDANVVAMVEKDEYEKVCAENEELHATLHHAEEEFAAFQLERTRAQAMELQIKNLEQQVVQVQREKRAMKEEQEEERALIESLRAMVQMYKKIAEARPFSSECSCKDTSDDEAQTITDIAPINPKTLHDDVIQMNLALKDEIASLKQQLEAVQSLPPPPAPDISLRDRIDELEDRLNVTKEMLKHTKQQWISALIKQREAQECCDAAKAELVRMHDLLNHQLGPFSSDSNPQEGRIPLTRRPSIEDDWVQDNGVHPAPPGDLNSPLIQCLLDHWTQDKSQRRALSEWLQSAISDRTKGPTQALRLDRLSSEVSAGFIQLLVPILRKVHGVDVTIMKRASMHVLSDLILDVSKAKVPIPAPSSSIHRALIEIDRNASERGGFQSLLQRSCAIHGDQATFTFPNSLFMRLRLWLLLLFVVAVCAEDLYELLGASSGATSQELKRIYRKLSLKYHPDKQAPEDREAAEKHFIKIANAYRVLSDPERREKYDLYGIADDQGFKNFDEAFKSAHDSYEDTPLNWIALILICLMGIVPVFLIKSNKGKQKTVNNARREALLATSKAKAKRSPKDD
ncbi:hypothetical protein THRCLA_09161 [Thraustotheca clavata]|uniref:J domain-containing protein n=1 Tax=Thraustotheca clavata TaxID=74557 RepID=A0A1V9YYJ5_9STRA|nr:hypothetical protein THRCLA_09161 [Thraustotheca clavata]